MRGRRPAIAHGLPLFDDIHADRVGGAHSPRRPRRAGRRTRIRMARSTRSPALGRKRDGSPEAVFGSDGPGAEIQLADD